MLNINPEYYKSDNFITEKQAVEITKRIQKEGKTVGVSTGSFDLLHPGHIAHLIAAKKLCDVLIVAVAKNENSSKKFPKTGRPIFSDKLRAYMMCNLKCVDYVILDNGTTNRTLPNIKPNFYIKGRDYNDVIDLDIIKEKKLIESLGGEIVFTDTEKLATTDILSYIKHEIKDIKEQKKTEIY